MAHPRYRLSRAHRKIERTTGNITLNGAATTVWEEVAAESGGPGTGLFDITLEAQVGDDIEVGMSSLLGTEAVTIYLDVAFIVSAAAVGYVGGTGASGDSGIQSWRGDGGLFQKLSGGDIKTVTSPLITTTGHIVLRPMFRVGTSATARTLYATTVNPFRWWVKNLGPADPE